MARGHPGSPQRQARLLPTRPLGPPDSLRFPPVGDGAPAERPLSRKARRRAGAAAGNGGGRGGGGGAGGGGGPGGDAKGGGGAPPCTRFEDIKVVPPTAAVAALYEQLPHLSKADGMRFGSVDALRSHLDWVFAYNQRKRSRAAGGASRCWLEPLAAWVAAPLPGSGAAAAPASLGGGAGGGAGADGTSGVGGGGVGGGGGGAGDAAADGSAGGGGGGGDGGGGAGAAADGAAAAGAWVQVGDEEREACAVCGEDLEATWSDDAGAWGYPAAVRAPDGSVFHASCWATTARSTAAGAAAAAAAAGPPPPPPATTSVGGEGGEPLAKRLRVGP